MKDPYEVLIKPVITEKANLGAQLACPQYTFEVAINTNKVEVKQAVESCFKVRVKSVNTIRMKGKRKRLRTQKMGRRRDWKKAIVVLESGQKIDLV
jgi:large subunit ribosomal protein L23